MSKATQQGSRGKEFKAWLPDCTALAGNWKAKEETLSWRKQSNKHLNFSRALGAGRWGTQALGQEDLLLQIPSDLPPRAQGGWGGAVFLTISSSHPPPPPPPPSLSAVTLLPTPRR